LALASRVTNQPGVSGQFIILGFTAQTDETTTSLSPASCTFQQPLLNMQNGGATMIPQLPSFFIFFFCYKKKNAHNKLEPSLKV